MCDLIMCRDVCRVNVNLYYYVLKSIMYWKKYWWVPSGQYRGIAIQVWWTCAQLRTVTPPLQAPAPGDCGPHGQLTITIPSPTGSTGSVVDPWEPFRLTFCTRKDVPGRPRSAELIEAHDGNRLLTTNLLTLTPICYM